MNAIPKFMLHSRPAYRRGVDSIGFSSASPVGAAHELPTTVRDYIRQVAANLDKQTFPLVLDGGIVAPSDCAAPSSLGEETTHDITTRFSSV